MKRGRPKRSQDVVLVCQTCRKEFIVPDYVARTNPKYCSRACYFAPGQHRPRRLRKPATRICPICTTPFEVGGRGFPRGTQRCCSVQCARRDIIVRGLHPSGSKPGHHYGSSRTDLAASESPTGRDIIWTAGFYEGEGWCRYGTGSQHVGIGQNNLWPLQAMQRWYGGLVTVRKNRLGGNFHEWHIHGTRARGFLMTVYCLLSPRRQAQITKALGR